MSLLQVRDFPAPLYGMLAQKAEDENRSITQQTVYMLSQLLSEDSNTAVSKAGRRNALNTISSLNLRLPEDVLSPEDLIRQDREDFDR